MGDTKIAIWGNSKIKTAPFESYECSLQNELTKIAPAVRLHPLITPSHMTMTVHGSCTW